MTIAIMQPYIFPYIGYYQLVKSADTFVFYDDVNFIKQGWINRNRIIVNGQVTYFTINCFQISSYKKINETILAWKPYDKNKFLKTIEYGYLRAPYFKSIYPLIVDIVNCQETRISHYAANSVIKIATHFNLKTKFKFSSEAYNNNHLERNSRLIDICKQENALKYINAIGGEQLYDKSTFQTEGIELLFLKSGDITYKQLNNHVEPNLSILDALMNCSKDEIVEMLTNFGLV